MSLGIIKHNVFHPEREAVEGRQAQHEAIMVDVLFSP